MDNIKKIKSYFDNKINFYNKQLKDLEFNLETNLIITQFIYEDIQNCDYRLLEIFCDLHLNFHFNTNIYIFTNISDLEKKLQFKSNRIIFIHVIPFDYKFMDTKVILNFLVMHKAKGQMLFFFDFDLIPLNPYLGRLETNNVAVTFNHEWEKIPKFPINAGFLVINSKKKTNINRFNYQYLNSYFFILVNQKIIRNKTNLISDKYDFSEWWGDQFAFIKLFDGLKIPIFDEKLELSHNDINYQFFNERNYNYQPYKLKNYIEGDERIHPFIERLRYTTIFIHLTGKRKIHKEKIYECIKNNLI